MIVEDTDEAMTENRGGSSSAIRTNVLSQFLRHHY